MEKTCTYSKETFGMYRWDATVGKTLLEIYINKWRVPTPCPSEIFVEISNQVEDPYAIRPIGFKRVEDPYAIRPISQKEASANPQLCHNSITAEITYLEDHTLTVKYAPVLSKDTREIGDLYIPYTLLPDPPPKQLVIVIKWEQ